MPLLNGIEAARQIAREVPRARVLILSTYSDNEHLCQAVEAGVAGYLMKESASDDLLEAVRVIRNGGASFSPPLLNQLLKKWRQGPSADSSETSHATLSSRQAETLQLIAEGYGTKQIAGLLSLAKKTVEKHRHSLMHRLGLHKIASLTRYAASSGVIEPTNFPPLAPRRPPTRENNPSGTDHQSNIKNEENKYADKTLRNH
jgi:DNA-binding NarL/FixJ family response regulator